MLRQNTERPFTRHKVFGRCEERFARFENQIREDRFTRRRRRRRPGRRCGETVIKEMDVLECIPGIASNAATSKKVVFSPASLKRYRTVLIDYSILNGHLKRK